MSVNYSAVLYVGKQFEDAFDAQDFYERFFDIDEENEEYIDNNGFAEFFCFELENGLSGETMNCYSGQGFVFGIDIGSYVFKPESFAEEVCKAISKWKELFGEEKYEIIHAVRVY